MIKVIFYKEDYKNAGVVYTDNDDITKLKLPDNVNMVVYDYPNGKTKSYLIGDIVYDDEKSENSKDIDGQRKSWLQLFNGPKINYTQRTNIISPQKLNLSNSNKLRHIAYTMEYPFTEGYIKKFTLKEHNVKEVKIIDDFSPNANFIELYDLTPDNEKINVEYFAIGVSLTLNDVKKQNKKIYDYMIKNNISQSFMDARQRIFAITEENVTILNPNTFNKEGFYDPDNSSYIELE